MLDTSCSENFNGFCLALLYRLARRIIFLFLLLCQVYSVTKQFELKTQMIDSNILILLHRTDDIMKSRVLLISIAKEILNS